MGVIIEHTVVMTLRIVMVVIGVSVVRFRVPMREHLVVAIGRLPLMYVLRRREREKSDRSRQQEMEDPGVHCLDAMGPGALWQLKSL